MQAIFRMGGTFAVKNSDGTYSSGGPERLQSMEFLLTNLADLNVSCYLLTEAPCDTVGQCLVRWGLARHFVGTSGNLRILQTRANEDGYTVKDNLEKHGLTAASAVYVDNFAVTRDRVTQTIPGIQIHGGTLTEKDCREIIGEFQLKAIQARGGSSDQRQAIFDFDCTLTYHMVFNDLLKIWGGASPTGEMAKAMPDDWWIGEFGGQERIKTIGSMLAELRGMGVKCYVCSMNVNEVIMEGLARVGLLLYFQNTQSMVRIIPRGLPNKGMRVRQHLATHGINASHAVFVDDDPRNITAVVEVNPGVGHMNATQQGLTAAQCESIIAQFRRMA